jgi:hypothetical protein
MVSAHLKRITIPYADAGGGVVGALAATRMLETRNRRLEDIAP